MKDYHRSNICRLIGSDKKKSKIKTHKKESECKCLSPYLKLHHYSCPLTRHPCPIHDRHGEKEKKTSNHEPEDSLIVSFHPSVQTDRLFQPVKELLTRKCAPDTKISFQYYSPAEGSNYKSCEIQTNSREFKNLGTNYFLEKTKSFVDDKKSSIKKIKHGFYLASSALSAKKTRSQISMKENIVKGIFSEAKKTKDVSVSVSSDRIFKSKRPENESFSPIWYCCNKFESSDGERSFIPETDFLAVTQHLQDQNQLYHKIFEIRHKKGSNEFPYFKTKKKLSDIAPQVYFAGIESDRSKSNPFKKNIFKKHEPKTIKSTWEHPSNVKNQRDKNLKNNVKDLSGSDKSQTDTSGSVYFTPFVLVPKDASDYGKKSSVIDRGIQVDGANPSLKPQKSRQSTSSDNSQVSQEIRKLDYRPFSPEPVTKIPSDYKSRTIEPTSSKNSERERIIGTSVKEEPRYSFYRKGNVEEECQTSNNQQPFKSFRDQSVGTNYILLNKSSMAKPKYLSKGVQFPGSVTEVSGQKSNTSNETYVKGSITSKDSHPGVDKHRPYCKSFSDGELAKRKKCPCLKLEPEFPLPPKCQCTAQDSYFFDNKSSGLDDTRSNVMKSTTFAGYPQRVKVSKPATKDEAMNTSMSDLKELYKMMDNHMTPQDTSRRVTRNVPTTERGNSFDHCEIPPSTYKNYMRAAVVKETKTVEHSSTQTTKPDHKPCKCHTKIDPSKHKSSCPENEKQLSVPVCKICLKKINIVMVDVETLTDGCDSLELSNEMDRKDEYFDYKKRVNNHSSHNLPFECKPPRSNSSKPERMSTATHSSSKPSPNRSINKTQYPKIYKPLNGSTSSPRKNDLTCRTDSKNKVNGKSKSPVDMTGTHNPLDSFPSSSPNRSNYSSPNQRPASYSKPDPSKNKKTTHEPKFTYAVTVSPKWPKDIVNYMQGNGNEYFPSAKSSSSCVKQKRNFEKENDADYEMPFEKKLKNDTYDVNDNNYDANDFNYNMNNYNSDVNHHNCTLSDLEEQEEYCECDVNNSSSYIPVMKNSSFFNNTKQFSTSRRDAGFYYVPSGSTPRFVVPNIPIANSIKSVKSEEKFAAPNMQKTQKTCSSLLSIKNDEWQEEKPVQNLFECYKCKSLTVLQSDAYNYQSGGVDLRLQSLRKSVMSDLELMENRSAELTYPNSEEENAEEYANSGSNVIIANCYIPQCARSKRSFVKKQVPQKPQQLFSFRDLPQKVNVFEESCKNNDQPSTSKSSNTFWFKS